MNSTSRSILTASAAVLCAFTVTSARADTFGSGANTFTIDFVSVPNPGNSADTTGYGAVIYDYRIGTFEISQDQIEKANANGLNNVTAGAWTGHQPAANISWYETAAFVNWLNTSIGKQAPYDLKWTGSVWTMSLWSSADAWQFGGENLYRHKDAYYFLPSEDEWYKAAHYDPSKNGGSGGYWLYPTGSDTAPTPATSGTDAGTAVYNQSIPYQGPSIVAGAGGASPYGTIGQGGNVAERTESAYAGIYDDAAASRTSRGGWFVTSELSLRSTLRVNDAADGEGNATGFRVASVPEPTAAVSLLLGLGVLASRRNRQARAREVSV